MCYSIPTTGRHHLPSLHQLIPGADYKAWIFRKSAKVHDPSVSKFIYSYFVHLASCLYHDNNSSLKRFRKCTHWFGRESINEQPWTSNKVLEAQTFPKWCCLYKEKCHLLVGSFLGVCDWFWNWFWNNLLTSPNGLGADWVKKYNQVSELLRKKRVEDMLLWMSPPKRICSNQGLGKIYSECLHFSKKTYKWHSL